MKCKLTPVLLSLALAGTLAVPALAADGKHDAPDAAQQLLIAEKPGGGLPMGPTVTPSEVNGERVDAVACVMVPLAGGGGAFGVHCDLGLRQRLGGQRYDPHQSDHRVDQYVITTSKENLVG